mgnify:CR=1 FL=1
MPDLTQFAASLRLLGARGDDTIVTVKATTPCAASTRERAHSDLSRGAAARHRSDLHRRGGPPTKSTRTTHPVDTSEEGRSFVDELRPRSLLDRVIVGDNRAVDEGERGGTAHERAREPVRGRVSSRALPRSRRDASPVAEGSSDGERRAATEPPHGGGRGRSADRQGYRTAWPRGPPRFDLEPTTRDVTRTRASRIKLAGTGTQTLEAQADAWATPIVRDQPRARAEVFRAARARRPIGLGPGHRLPDAFRRRAERVLGVDLGAVRMHFDRTAGRELDRAGASGLACGTDVLLRGPIRTPRDQHILAHELVHVAQQTAIEDAHGRLRCIAGVGTAAPQPFVERPEFADKPPDIDGVIDNWSRRRTDAKTTAAYNDIVAELSKKAAGGSSAVDDKVKAATTAGLSGSASEDQAAFAYDLLKSKGHYSSAIVLLKRHGSKRITTTFHDAGIVERAKEKNWSIASTVATKLGNLKWIYYWWSKHPDLRTFRPEKFVESGILGPALLPRPESGGGGGGVFKHEIQRVGPLFEGLSATAGELGHELFVLTHWAVRELNLLRLATLEGARSEYERLAKEANVETSRLAQGYEALKRRTFFADYIETVFARLGEVGARRAAGGKGTPSEGEQAAANLLVQHVPGAEAQALVFAISGVVVQAAGAARLANRVALDVQGTAAGEVIEGLGIESHAFMELFATSDKLSGFRDAYAAALRKMLELKGDPPELPAMWEYNTRRNTARNELRRAIYDHIDPAQIKAVDAIQAAVLAGHRWQHVVDPRLLAVRAYARVIVAQADKKLGEYQLGLDSAQALRHAQRVAKARVGSKNAPPLETMRYTGDYRAKHMVETARAVQWIGIESRFHVLVDIAHPVLHGDLDDPTSHAPAARAATLIFEDEQWHGTESTYSRLLEERSAHSLIRGMEPLTLATVVNFLETADFAATKAFIDAALDPTKKNSFVDASGAPKESILPKNSLAWKLNAQMQTRQRPKRWEAAPVYFLGIEPDWSDYISTHPKTLVTLVEERKAGRPLPMFSERPENPATLWTLPDVSKVVTRMRTDPAIDRAMRIYYYTKELEQELEEGATAPPLPDMSDAKWSLFFLRALNTAGAGETSPKAEGKALRDTIASDREKARRKLMEAYLRFSIHTRQYYTAVWLEPLANQAGAHMTDRFTLKGVPGNLLGIQVASELIDRMTGVSTMLAPPEHQGAHVTAMVLAIAPTLVAPKGDADDGWQHKRSHALIAEWFPIVETALARLAEPDKAPPGGASLDAVQTDDERKDRPTAKQALTTLRDGWLATAREVQGKFGLQGNKGGKSGAARGFLRPASGGNVIQAGAGNASLFQINGIRYVLKDVFKDFTYFNPYREDSKIGGGSELNPTSAPSADASILYVDEGGKRDKLAPYEDDRKKHVLLKIIRTQGQSTTNEEITGDNDKRLRELSNAVGIHSTVVSLNALADAIETFAGLIMDGVELLPGVGQAVAAARIATAVIGFMADDKFDELMRMVKEDPIGQIKKGFARLEGILDPSKLWQFLLFGRFPLKVPPEEPPRRPGMGRSVGQKLAAMVARIGRMGARLVSLFIRFQRATMSKLDAARLFVLSRSPLAAVVAAVSRYLHLLDGVSLDGLFGEDAKSLRTRIQEGAGKLGGRVKSMFDGLATLTIPKKIIPLGQILEVVVELIARSLKGKYKYAATGFMRILDLVPEKKKELFDAIASNFEGTDADPNVFLVDQIKKHVSPHVKDGANFLFDALHDQVGPFVKGVVGADTFADALGSRPDIELKTDEGEEIAADDPDPPMEDPLAQPSMAPGAVPRRTTVGPLPTGGGQALPGAMRSNLESRIGHDLGHVRIHQDASAGRLNADLGANALTSGSHVFLGRGVNPSTASGAHILRHEIGHVLDQVGPRPAGGSFDSRPHSGAPGRGLVLDSGRESFADAVAGAMKPADVPSLDRARSSGLQPSLLTEVAGPLLEEVSSGARLTRRAAADVEHEGDGDRSLSPNHRRHAENVWTNLTSEFATKLEMTGTFGAAAVKEQLLKRLKQREPTMQRGLEEAAASALVLLAPQTRGHDPIPFLDPHRFSRALVGLVFGGSGILISLRTKKVEGSVPGAKREKQPYVNPQDPVQSMSVAHVDLAEIHGGDTLWQLALNQTKVAHKASFVSLTAVAELFKNLSDNQSRLKLRARLRPIIAGRSGAGVWLGSKFAFRKSILDELEVALRAPKNVDVVDPATNPIPTRTEYLAHAKVESDRKKNLGLRIGRFSQSDQLKGSGKVVVSPGGEKFERLGQQRGLERESHHTTQFLLMEYFHGRSSNVHPFPRLAQAPSNKTGGKQLYPGLVASGRDVTQFDGDGPPMLVQKFFTGRGGLMPAILIARVTHRSGNLHVSTTSTDFEGSQGEGQSWAAHNKFRTALMAALGNLAADYKAKETAAGQPAPAVANAAPPLELFRKWMSGHEATVKSAISTAMRSVYRWMYFDVMKDALRDGLKALEIPYYNDLAEAANKADRLDDGDMNGIATVAEQNNARIMKESGFEV